MTSRTITVGERRARLARRQLLAASCRAGSAEEVAGALVALHASDPATVFLSALARMKTPSVEAVEQALYEDRTLVRMHGMRQTIFVFPAALADAIQASTTRDLWAKERKQLLKHAEDAGLDAAWLDRVEADTLAELRRRGSATGAELGKAVPGLRDQVLYGKGTKWEAWQPASARVLRVLGFDGAVVRRRPVGSWISSQHRWEVGAGHAEVDPAAARADVLRGYLRTFGPATLGDVKWWTGWKATDVKKALAAVGAIEIGLESGTGWLLSDDLQPVAEVEPWAALLPGLDPTPMAWQERDWYLAGALKPDLFDRSGNIGPTVWWNGEIVGGWAQRPDGSVAIRLLATVSKAAEKVIGAEAERWTGLLGDIRVTPRFRTPLERELAG